MLWHPTRRRARPASREQLLCRDEPDVVESRRVIEEAAKHVLHGRADFPVMRGQTEIAAEEARFVEPADELVERRAGNQAVTAELRVTRVAQHERVHEPIRAPTPGAFTKAADADPVAGRVKGPRAHRL